MVIYKSYRKKKIKFYCRWRGNHGGNVILRRKDQYFTMALVIP